MAYIANMPDGQLPPWLSAGRLMLWTLRVLRDLNREMGRDCGGGAHLDLLHRRLGQLLRIPEDLLWLEYPPEARQEDYVVRHRMRFALTDLGFLGLVNSHGQGNWSLSDEGADFLKPLDEEDAPMAERDWSRETGIELTPVEMLLSNRLIADQQADRRTRYLPRPPDRPDDWPEGPFRSRGAPRPPDELLTTLAKFQRNTEKFIAARSRTEEFSRLLAPLDPREREILKLRFGLDSGEQRSLEEIAEHFGMSRERVRQIEARAMAKLRRLSEDSPRTLVAGFEGTCVICDKPINIGDAVAIQYQRAKPTGFWWHHFLRDAPPVVEGWRHDRCSRSGPGGTRVPARVPPPGNPPKESAVRRH